MRLPNRHAHRFTRKRAVRVLPREFTFGPFWLGISKVSIRKGASPGGQPTADSLALRSFLGFELSQSTPDHSTISRTRRLIDVETHRKVFLWVLSMLAEEGLLKGNTVAIDGTTLEANAALRSIVRRDTGEGYDDFLKGLAKESGIETPTREQLAKLDRK